MRNSVFSGVSVLIKVVGADHLYSLTLAASLRRVQCMSVMAGVVPPCTREVESNSGSGEAPTSCELPGLSVSLHHVVLLCCNGATAWGPTQWWPS
jgi:hypothetical protein